MDAVVTDQPHALLADATRRAVDQARARVRAGSEAPEPEEIAKAALLFLEEHRRSTLQPVVNATGVLIHTNLGRVPLGQVQMAAVVDVAGSYSNLEYDLQAGGRGTRYAHARRLLRELTGAEDGLVVNNNAAAVLLALAGTSAGKEVIISRGELVEIGGEFRIPEVMEIAGAQLVEVGTTNRTHLRDYEKAIGPDTAAVLKVHPSNYRVVGFTSSVDADELARLARGRGLCFIHDLGSGLINTEVAPEWARAEPSVTRALEEGADVVTFSGDKLLGGPQAGIVVGRHEVVSRLTDHALLRALRIDKMTLAALERTLELYLHGRAHELPLWAFAGAALGSLDDRAAALAERINDELDGAAQVVHTQAVAGGGSLPGTEVESRGVALRLPAKSAAEIERALRAGQPPVVARVEADEVVLDLRTVPESEDGRLAALVVSALRG